MSINILKEFSFVKMCHNEFKIDIIQRLLLNLRKNKLKLLAEFIARSKNVFKFLE